MMSEWIEWREGMDRPSLGTEVEIKLRDGWSNYGQAQCFDWRIDGIDADIVAFRIVSDRAMGWKAGSEQGHKLDDESKRMRDMLDALPQGHMMSVPEPIGIEWDPRTDEIKPAYAPTRQHMSDAARIAHRGPDLSVSEAVFAAAGTVLLTVAEHDELLKQSEARVRAIESTVDMLTQVEIERDALCAEVERLKEALRGVTLAQAREALRSDHAEERVNERLRKGRDASQADTDSRGGACLPIGDNAVEVCARSFDVPLMGKGRDDGRVVPNGTDGSVPVGTNRSGDNVHSLGDRLMAGENPLDHRLGIPQPDGEPVAPMSGRKAYRWGQL